MNPQQLCRQMLDFNKIAFNNTFLGMTMLQDQAERITSACFEQAVLFRKEGKKAFEEWTNACKKGRESCKTSMDECFKTVETYLDELSKNKQSAL